MIYVGSGGLLSSLYFSLNVPLFRPNLGTECHSVQIWISSLKVRNEELFISPPYEGYVRTSLV